MKFVGIFLGAVAIGVATPLDEDAVQNAVTADQNYFNNLRNLVQVLSSKTQSEARIYSTISGMESTISQILLKGGYFALCAQKSLDDLVAFKNNLDRDIKNCTENLGGNLSGLEADVVSQISSLRSSVSNLVDVLEDCSAGFLKSIICTITKTKEIGSFVQFIILQAASVIQTSIGKGNNVVGHLHSCVEKSTEDISSTVNKILFTVKMCT